MTIGFLNYCLLFELTIIFHSIFIENKMKSLHLTIFVCFFSQSLSNIICNGNFEVYDPSLPFDGTKYKNIIGDRQCWYKTPYYQYFQVKEYFTPITTVGAELTISSPYTLCQTLYLEIASIYQLQFDAYAPDGILNMKMSATTNGELIGMLNIANSNTFGTSTLQLEATINQNELCFSEIHDNDPFNLNSAVVGGLIDNISLVKISSNIINNQTNTSTNTSANTTPTTNTSTNTTPTTNTSTNTTPTTNTSTNTTPTTNINYTFTQNQTENSNKNQTYNQSQMIIPQVPRPEYANFPIKKTKIIINFQVKMIEEFWQIVLESDLKYSIEMKEILNRYSKIYIEKELQKQFQFTQDDNGYLKVVIKAERTYDVSRIEFQIDGYEEVFPYLQFEVFINGKNVYFNYLSQEEAMIVEKVQPIANQISNIFVQIYKVISVSLFAYFIMNMFAFWNLSLMYNFLIIESVPNFTKYFYQILLKMMVTEGSVSKWIIEQFDFPEDTFKIPIQENIKEKMVMYQQGYTWFGYYDISTKFFDNNLDSFFLLAFTIIKIFIFKFIAWLLPTKIQRALDLREKIKWTHLIFGELITMAVYGIVSSLTVLYETNDQTYLESIWRLGHILLLFVFIMMLPIMVVLRAQQNKKNIKKMKKESEQEMKVFVEKLETQVTYERIQLKERILKMYTRQKNAKIKKQRIYQSELLSHEIQQLLLVISIPSLVVLKMVSGFLIINSILTLYRVYHLLKNIKRFQLKQKVFTFLMTLIWFIHHFTFCIFYLIDQLRDQDNEKLMGDISVKCGIIVMITVLVGGIIEIIKIGIELLYYIIVSIKRLIQAYKTKNSVSDIPIKKHRDRKKRMFIKKVRENQENRGKSKSKKKRQKLHKRKKQTQPLEIQNI